MKKFLLFIILNLAIFGNSNDSLFWGIEDGNIQSVKKAIKDGANIEMANSDNYTPLMYSCLESNKDITKLLLDYGAKVNAKNKNGDTALSIAAECDNVDTLKLLIFLSWCL